MCENIADLAHYNFAKYRIYCIFAPLKQIIMEKLIGREIEQQKLAKYMQS